MRQSNNKKFRDVTAFLYERLSRDDMSGWIFWNRWCLVRLSG